MTLLYISWGYIHEDEIIIEFENKGIEIKKVKFPLKNEVVAENFQKEEYRRLLENEMDESVDIIFTINFFSEVSEWCERRNIPYASWILELPNYDLYTKSVFNCCNYIGVCDSYIVEKLLKIGVNKVFLLPDAVGREIEEPKVFKEREFCYISKRPQKTLNYLDVSLYAKGYLEAFLHVQRVIPGEMILETGLLNRVYGELLNNNKIPPKILSTMEKLYFADYYLNPECVALRENIFIQNHSSLITIYSNEDFSMCNTIINPYIEEGPIRRRIYAEKEFSLILTPYTQHNAIDRNALEVICAGGFPICSYQKDYDIFFTKDKNLVYFKNEEEFLKIITWYGNDQEERKRIIKEAYYHVKENHTYKNRIDTMIHFWNKLS